VTTLTRDDLARFARLAREGRAIVLGEDRFDGFVTVRAAGITLEVSPLAWWHVQNNEAAGAVYLAAEVLGARHPGL
jgi:hypothetical protein